MIRFIDLDTGHLYDGTAPYIHWFPGEQGTNLKYIHKICICSTSENVTVAMDSDTFSIVDMKKLEAHEGTAPGELELSLPVALTQKLISEGNSITVGSETVYLHIIYFSGSSASAIEARTDVTIQETVDGVATNYNVILGADFYDENESLYINLSNLGVELPDSIQKAIYDINIRECYRDNIILNRKLKELISNYWDTIANKGSYKSLLNTLEWFEWGDLVRIREIWQHEDFGRTVYDDRALCSVLEDKYKDTLNNFSKTTHISLYVTMQELLKDICESCGEEHVIYNQETLVPEIDNIIIPKWSKNDLLLKMCMLGNFYETYFMPIHLNLFHATIEDIVFSPAIGLYTNTALNRHDSVYNVSGFDCNIKSNDSFVLSNVSCQVGPNTFFGSKWENEEDYIPLYGVEDVVDNITDDSIKTFYGQIFNGIGAIVPFKCSFDVDSGDYVTESTLVYDDVIKTHAEIIYPDGDITNKKINIEFKLLFHEAKKYNISIQFKTAGSKTYVRTFKINIVDISNMDIKVYRVKPYAILTDKYINMFNNEIPVSHMYKRSRCADKCTDCAKFIIQYVPGSSTQYNSGICLNNILVLKGDHRTDYILNSYYHMSIRTVDENTRYTICVSKYFWFNPKIQIANFENKYNHYIYRNDYGFFPEFHYIEEMNYDSLENCTLGSTETIVVIPELPYGLKIKDWTWQFKNASRGTVIELPDVRGPLINDTARAQLQTGYYDIVFRCSVANDDNDENIIHEITKESAFRKK